MKTSRTIEYLLLALGVFGISVYLLVRIHGVVSSRAALASFEALQQPPPRGEDRVSEKRSLLQPLEVDFSLWSSKRISDYRDALTRHVSPPLAVLRVPKIHLEVPVFDGTDELTLNHGVGRIIGTSKPGQPGNVGIAGHRDGFFRGLKDIGVGDAVVLITLQGIQKYGVDHVQIVEPDDVSILSDRGFPSLTMVTCYPFYFIGDAPQRYIVQCSLKEDRITKSGLAGSRHNHLIKTQPNQ
jgi:sortase A